LRAPYLVADRNRQVHAFDMESGGGFSFEVMHRTWSLAQGWSSPVDVILPAYMGVAPTIQGVALDEAGVLHLIYHGGDPNGGSIYYTWAYAAEADSARAWATPVPVGEGAGTVGSAALAGDGKGVLVIAYGGNRVGAGLYEVHSTDGGATWSGPILVSRSSAEDTGPGSIWLETDEQGRVHAVWDVIDNRGRGLEIRYARLEADLSTWGEETVLARADDDQELLGAPSIISSGEGLEVVYQDSFPATRWVRSSPDGGQTWTPPVRPFPHVGGYGPAALVRDSADAIHMVLGNRIPIPETHGMWYSRRVGRQWLPLEPIISGRSTSTFDPCCPQAVISQGNVLLATWPHNVRTEFLTGAWYSFTILDAPELPVVAPASPPVATSTPTAVPSETAPAPASPTATAPTFSGSAAAPRPGGNPSTPILLGMVPVVGFVALLILGRLSRRSDAAPTPPKEPPDVAV
jgi:hypothetical protein